MSALRSAILGLFIVQITTGVVLMTAYSPSTTSAWGSVWYIQTQLPGGDWIRGIHHFASEAFLILLLLSAGRWLVDRGCQGQGWRLWWGILFGLGLALALSLTGHLLPWDQEGFWGTTVRANILARTPLVGESLRRLLLGGSELGALTLTRFYTLHVVVLPLVFAGLICRLLVWSSGVAPPLVGGVDQNRDHSHPSRDRKGAGPFHAAALFTFTMILVFSATWYAKNVLGSDFLDAPADRTATDYPARPEWHTLFLFQWLKFFQGPTSEVVGAFVIPGILTLVLLSFPFLGWVFSEKLAHRIARTLSSTFALAFLMLTAASLWTDRNPSDSVVAATRSKRESGQTLTAGEESKLRARQFNAQRVQARTTALRALELARLEGIPPEGPGALLARDPQTQGPKLFAANCASCHRFNGHDGLGQVPADPATSSDLAGFASRDWIRGLLENPMSDRYFGKMRTPEGDPAHTRMDRFIRERLETADESMRAQISAEYDAVAAFLSDQSRDRKGAGPPIRESDPLVTRGREVFTTVCNECHSYAGERTGTTRAPEMQGYGSVEWIELMIAEPDHETRYRSTGRERARMPRFKERLSDLERRMLAEWLRNDR